MRRVFYQKKTSVKMRTISLYIYTATFISNYKIQHLRKHKISTTIQPHGINCYKLWLYLDNHSKLCLILMITLSRQETPIRKFNSKLNFYKLIPYLVDRCICPAPCRSRQTLEKNVLSWALAGTGSVLFTRQVAVQPTCRYTAHACACALPLFVVYLMTPCWL